MDALHPLVAQHGRPSISFAQLPSFLLPSLSSLLQLLLQILLKLTRFLSRSIFFSCPLDSNFFVHS